MQVPPQPGRAVDRGARISRRFDPRKPTDFGFPNAQTGRSRRAVDDLVQADLPI